MTEPQAEDTDASPARLFSKLQIVRSEAEQRALIADLAVASGPRIVSFLNAHAVNLAWRDTAVRQTFLGADVLLRDGIGVALALRWLGLPRGLNMNGTDFIPRLLKELPPRRIALFGTGDEVLEKAAACIEALGHRVVARRHGFSPVETYLSAARACAPDLVLLGLGMPRQELLAKLLARDLSGGVLIINGGAVFDFMAGRFRRAPSLMRRAGLEWVFRLMLEPRRLGSRYLAGNARFIARILAMRKPAQSTSPAPSWRVIREAARYAGEAKVRPGEAPAPRLEPTTTGSA